MMFGRQILGHATGRVPNASNFLVVRQWAIRFYSFKGWKPDNASIDAAFDAGDGVADDAGRTTTVFRVQGGTPPLASRRLITLDADNNPRISATTLNISIGNPKHAEYFLKKRPGSDITSFEIPQRAADLIDKNAVPQANYKTNPANQGETAPKVVDPTTPGRSYELPSVWARFLQKVAIPGSGKIKKGDPP